MTGDRHDSATSLVAQGVANVVVPLFGGTGLGAIARTATNILRRAAASPA
jgi:SulP family sulfate permease